MRNVFRFENIARPGGTRVVPQDQDPFTLVGFTAVDQAAPVGGDGVVNVVAAGSGSAAAVNTAGGIPLFIASEELFDLRSAVVAALRVDALTLTVTGFRDGVEVAEETFLLDQGAERLSFGREFRDINFVTFTPSGGGSSNPFDPLANNFVAVDNLAVRLSDADVQPFG